MVLACFINKINESRRRSPDPRARTFFHEPGHTHVPHAPPSHESGQSLCPHRLVFISPTPLYHSAMSFSLSNHGINIHMTFLFAFCFICFGLFWIKILLIGRLKNLDRIITNHGVSSQTSWAFINL